MQKSDIQEELPLSSTTAAESHAKPGKKRTVKPKASASKSSAKPKLPNASFADMMSAAIMIQEERADALSLLQSATILELTQPASAKRDKKLKAAFLKWMAESDINTERFQKACDS